MQDVTKLQFYIDRETVINQHIIEVENNLSSPKNDRLYADKTTQAVVKRIELIEALNAARRDIWVTVEFNDMNEDGTTNIRVVDAEMFKVQRAKISSLVAQLSKTDKAIIALNGMNCGYFDDIKRVVDTNNQKVHHLQSKLASLDGSTRVDQDILKQQVKEAREELSVVTSECQKHQTTLDKMDKILVQVGL